MPRYEEVRQRAGSLRTMTGLPPQEFTALLPHFDHACQAYREHHTMDGHPRTSRRYSPYGQCPLSTMADKLLVLLTSLTQNPSPETQGQLFGMSQSKATQWLHLLHTVVHQA